MRHAVALFVLLGLGTGLFLSADAPAADLKVKPYKIVRIQADDVSPKAALIWRVTPAKDVSRATSPRGMLEFTAPPGQYLVELLIITSGPDGALSVEERTVSVEIECGCAKSPPKIEPVPPAPKQPGAKKPDPVAAIGRIQFGSAGCTATVIGPRRTDGKWDVLTATHCVSTVGEKGTLYLKDGRKIGVRVAFKSKEIEDGGPDCAWLVTDAAIEDVPFAVIAEKNPAAGAKIWHMGYGIDKPGNREDGEVTAAENSRGQLTMHLSVSSGDSGGGIFDATTGELIAVVCCTQQRGAKAAMYGCSAAVARKLRPTVATSEEWIPTQIPAVSVSGVRLR